jgi:hypothetical protein
MTFGSFFLGVDSLEGVDSAMEFIPLPPLARINSSMRKFLSDTVIKREEAHKLDEKSKIETLWAMGDSIPHSVPTRSLLCFY